MAAHLQDLEDCAGRIRHVLGQILLALQLLFVSQLLDDLAPQLQDCTESAPSKPAQRQASSEEYTYLQAALLNGLLHSVDHVVHVISCTCTKVSSRQSSMNVAAPCRQ